MSIVVSKTFTFEAAHFLPNHDGKCRNLHGHSYVVEVAYGGRDIPERPEGDSEEGMLIDFARIKALWKDIEPRLDHAYLNESLAPEVKVTTAEVIATWILDKMMADRVRLWETKSSCVEVTRPGSVIAHG